MRFPSKMYLCSSTLTTMKFISTFFFACVLFSNLGFSQGPIPCGTDEMHQQLFLEHPEYNVGIQRAYERLQTFTAHYLEQETPKSGDPYIIPIVFHVIHNYGAENISDAQILDAVKQLNSQFRKLNPDTSEIVPLFKSRAADCEIEFRLAQLDPDGNCTSGITRTVSPLTKIGDHQVKSLIHWPPNKYLNVYICNQAAGLAGHALLPSAADTIPQWDGIVMQHSYIGTIGTSDYFRRTVLSHEVGHFLNLQHIWGGNNVPDYYYLPVGQASNCGVDDEVEDTPNTIGWQTCNLNGQSCGELDNVQNYMDYAYCALMFTEGQKARMHAALNSPVANRNNLWSAANLIATGTDDQTAYLCGAKFTADKQVVCVGDTVHFSDVSYHGATSRLWNFEGGNATQLSDSLPAVVYTNPGTYDVSLKASNGTDTVEIQLTDYITVLPAQGAIAGIDQGFEYPQHFYDNWILVDRGTPYNWDFTATGFNSNQSFKLNNFDSPISTTFEFYSHPFDASDLNSLAIKFDWAYGRIEGSEVDYLEVAVSKDCGESWYIVKNYVGASSLKTVPGFVEGPFIPTDASQWKQALITNTPPSYLVENTLVRFKFDNKGNNTIFIDNIQIGDPAELTTPELWKQHVSVYPNPASDQLHFKLMENHQVQKIEVFDLTGKLIHTFSSIAQTADFALDVNTLNSGFYLFKMEGQSGEMIFPQVIEH